MKIQYANWTDAAPQNLSQKDAQKLAKQLKTYVNSTKFIQDGSKVDMKDQQGVLKKAPVKNVTYYTDGRGKNPIAANQLNQTIRQALISKDPKKLRQASLYRFYTSQPIVTQKQQVKRQISNYRERLAKNSLILSSLLGASGAVLPIAQKVVKGKSINSNTLKSAALLAIAGVTSGLILSNITTKKVNL